jgi:lipopolysaccharide export LptBFGC system permease protein LptF
MLKILQRYLLRELLKTFSYVFVAILIIIFVVFALNMLYRGVNIIKMPRIMFFLLLEAFPYSLPLALLASVIMTYGRFSGDNEILAIRSSGLHLQGIIMPTMVLATGCSLFTLFVNGNLLPATEVKLRQLQREAIHLFVEQLGLAQQTFNFPGWEIFVRSKDGDVIKDVLVIKAENEVVTEVLKGREGALKRDPASGVWQLELKDVVSARLTDNARDLHWMKCDKGMVPIPLGRRKETGEERAKYSGLFTLFKERKALALTVLKHSQQFPDPAKLINRLWEDRDELSREIAELRDQADKMSALAGKLAEGEEASKRDADASLHRADELRQKLQQQEAQKRQLEDQVAAVKAEMNQREKERQRALEAVTPSPGEPKSSPAEPGKDKSRSDPEPGRPASDKPGPSPAATASASTASHSAPAERRPRTPEEQERIDSLTRQIQELSGNLEKLKGETAQARAAIELTQREIKDLQARAEEAKDFAAKRAQAKASTEEKVASLAHEKRALEDSLTEKIRIFNEAQEQERLHEVTCVLNERMALAFSSLAFVLIAVPLGIMCRHGHILVGFSIGIALILVYYAFFITGQILAQNRYFYVIPSYWAADGLLSGAGIVLLFRLFKG